ncbi:MAG TPA: YihY/virulence factor BrkB family protein [Puia sp.]|nr:YihY/virulence factor BrkB family protein [Puia sp.]
MKFLRRISIFFSLFKEAFFQFIDYNGLKLSAALSYYTVFSLGPFLIIIISLVGVFLGRQAVEGKVYSQLSGLVGRESALQIQEIIQNIQHANHGPIGSIIGFIILIIGASGVFSEIQDSLHFIWATRKTTKSGWLQLIIRRLLSFSLLLGMAFILLLSLLVNMLVELLNTYLKKYFSDSFIKFFYIANIAVIFLIITILLTLIFKILTNAIIRWRDAVVGSVMTAFLFLLGKFIVGFYLSKSSVGSTYGTAASIVIVMLWVYYSSIILYFGACFTKVYAKYFGHEIRPE